MTALSETAVVCNAGAMPSTRPVARAATTVKPSTTRVYMHAAQQRNVEGVQVRHGACCRNGQSQSQHGPGPRQHQAFGQQLTNQPLPARARAPCEWRLPSAAWPRAPATDSRGSRTQSTSPPPPRKPARPAPDAVRPLTCSGRKVSLGSNPLRVRVLLCDLRSQQHWLPPAPAQSVPQVSAVPPPPAYFPTGPFPWSAEKERTDRYACRAQKSPQSQTMRAALRPPLRRASSSRMVLPTMSGSDPKRRSHSP